MEEASERAVGLQIADRALQVGDSGRIVSRLLLLLLCLLLRLGCGCVGRRGLLLGRLQLRVAVVQLLLELVDLRLHVFAELLNLRFDGGTLCAPSVPHGAGPCSFRSVPLAVVVCA